MKKTTLLLCAGAVMASAPASAAIHTYDTTIGNGIGAVEITVDTNAQTMTIKGANADLVLRDSDFANWKPNRSRSEPSLSVDDISGTFTRNGKTYDAFFSKSPKWTKIDLESDKTFFWTYGRDSNGKVFDFDGKSGGVTYTSSTGGSSTSTSSGGSSGSTTTGGSSTSTSSGGSGSSSTTTSGGSSGGSSGGNPVPAPGILGLLGLALVGIGLGRRRRHSV